MKVLVTGASGLLGSGVARRLAARGDAVTVLQRRPSGLGLREVLADVADADPVRDALAGQEAVVHLAAKVDVFGPEDAYLRANVLGTRNVVEGCRQAGVRTLVYVSSPSVAHVGASLVGAGAGPADPGRARGPYARTKASAERLALAAGSPAGGSGLSVVAVRPHLVWGPGDPQLVGRVVARARAGRLPLVGSGAALMDTTYVANAVDALVAALDRADRARGQALVVSNGEPRPVAEILRAICGAAAAPPPRLRVPAAVATTAGAVAEGLWGLADRLRPGRAPTEPPLSRFLAEQLSTAHWFDQRHTREVLDWTPRVSLDEGFTELARWYASRRPPREGN
ncbi:MAG: NAD-dependent epimerase/dehydratase family protein [Actinomycetes bacterium]